MASKSTTTSRAFYHDHKDDYNDDCIQNEIKPMKEIKVVNNMDYNHDLENGNQNNMFDDVIPNDRTNLLSTTCDTTNGTNEKEKKIQQSNGYHHYSNYQTTNTNASTSSIPSPDAQKTRQKRAQKQNTKLSTDTTTMEFQQLIQRKPFLSMYILSSILFFGFTVGFSLGYLSSQKGYFGSSSSSLSSSSSKTTASLFRQQDYLIQQNSNNGEHTLEDELKSATDQVWNFMDEFIFHEHPYQQQHDDANFMTQYPPMIETTTTTTSSSTTSKSSNKQEQSNKLLRFPFQGTSTPTKKRALNYLRSPDAYALLIDSLSTVGVGSGSTIPATMSPYSNDFFLLSSGLDAQINQAYCGAATAVAIINSLRFLKPISGSGGSTTTTSTHYVDGVDIPVDNVYQPYHYATQHDIFNECTQKHVISHTGGGPGVDGILTPPFGLSMPQVAGVLRCHLNSTTASSVGWTVQEIYVDKSHITLGKMRFDLKNALLDPNSRVLVNYDRSAAGQGGGGHWSPVGSYSEKYDAFLILDVAKYKYPPVWIPTERLFDGLATYDDCGQWNFPNGQEVLSQEERMTHTTEGYVVTKEKLGCVKKLRGYIIVKRM